MMYSIMLEDRSLNSKYDWCHCEIKVEEVASVAAKVLGAAVAVVGTVLLIVSCIWACRKYKVTFTLTKRE